jgi:hypothetical protein
MCAQEVGNLSGVMLAICVEIDHEVAIQIANGEFESFG